MHTWRRRPGGAAAEMFASFVFSLIIDDARYLGKVLASSALIFGQTGRIATCPDRTNSSTGVLFCQIGANSPAGGYAIGNGQHQM